MNNKHDKKELIVLTTAGSVDDGKSTLIGRLLYDCDDIYEDQLEAIKEKDGLIKPESLALITDGLTAEREQGITIDVAYRHFSRPKRKFIMADVPGHEQYTRNMVTGASKANIALIIIDAKNGITLQSRRHLFITNLLGISHILIIVNKMDLDGYKKEVYEEVKNNFIEYAARLGISDLQFIPVSALRGDMIVNRGDNMGWFDGPTVLNYLENVQILSDRNLIDLRLPIQYVIKPKSRERLYAGKIEGGVLKKGDEILILPSRQKSKIKKIYSGGEETDYAFNPQSVAVELFDQLDVSRGDMIVREDNLPNEKNSFEAMLSWFSPKPLEVGKNYLIKHTTRTERCSISKIRYKINIESLHRVKNKQLELNDIGRVAIETNRPIFFDAYKNNKNTGSFIIIDELTDQTIAAGTILSKGEVFKENQKTAKKANKGFTLWLTGLSASGKSTLADAIYKELEKKDISLERLDGDIVRESLTKDLGFSREDRDENIKRVGFVAKLLSRNGIGVIASFVSPYKKAREELKKNIENFIEVFVDTPLEVCEKRDSKGLYKKARAGEIKNFTGISDPYEAPENPDIHLKHEDGGVEEKAKKVIKYLEEKNLI